MQADLKTRFDSDPVGYASGYLLDAYKRLYSERHGTLDGAFHADSVSVGAPLWGLEDVEEEVQKEEIPGQAVKRKRKKKGVVDEG